MSSASHVTDQIVATARNNGVPVESVAFPDEGAVNIAVPVTVDSTKGGERK